jgi:hypothetical protein
VERGRGGRKWENMTSMSKVEFSDTVKVEVSASPLSWQIPRQRARSFSRLFLSGFAALRILQLPRSSLHSDSEPLCVY